MEYVGIDWSYRRAAWCALSEAGAVLEEGAVAADEDGLARLVIRRGVEVSAVVEMMSGAIWVRDTLASAGWQVQIAHSDPSVRSSEPVLRELIDGLAPRIRVRRSRHPAPTRRCRSTRWRS